MREAVKGANVLYVTRVQKERFEDLNEYEKVKRAYVVDAALSVMPHQILLLCILYHECMRYTQMSTLIHVLVTSEKWKMECTTNGNIVPCLTWKTVNAWYVREKTNLVNKLIFLNLIYRIYTLPTVHLDIFKHCGLKLAYN